MMDSRTRQERRFSIQVRAPEQDHEGAPPSTELWVEGCAARYDSVTVLYTEKGIDYKEQIARGAFDDCVMVDTIFNYNHGGKVIARTRNGTLYLEVREDGLYIRARLDGTEEGRRLYEEIKGGYIDRMSFRFDIGLEEYDELAHLWTIRTVSRLWDVSAVDIPAYEDTAIEARRAATVEYARTRQAARRLLETRKKIDHRRGELRRKCALTRAKSIIGGR